MHEDEETTSARQGFLATFAYKQSRAAEILPCLSSGKAKQVSNKMNTQNLLLIGAVTIMVLTRSIDYILYVRLAHKMENYEWFLSQIVLSLSFCILSWPVVWYRMWTNAITKEMRSFPLKFFALIGLADALGNLISTIPAPYVSGPLNVVTAQAVIPFTMGFSLLLLRVRYHLLHYLGALIIGIGIAVNLVPSFAEKGALSGGLLWVFLLILSTVPMAGSNVLKEKGLKSNTENKNEGTKDMDVWYFNAWVALFQLLFGIAMAWTVFIPMPAPAESIPPKEFPQYLLDATGCFFGFTGADEKDENCGLTWLVFLVYIIFNITFNVMMLYVFQKGSAALAVLASAMRLALSSLGFHIYIIAGEATTTTFSPFDVIALVILIIGLIIYKVKEENTPEKWRQKETDIGAEEMELEVFEEESEGEHFGTVESSSDDTKDTNSTE